VQCPETRTGQSIVLSGPTGDRSILIYRGEKELLAKKEIAFSKLRTSWLYITSLSGNATLLGEILKYANKRNINVAWNPGTREQGLFKDGLLPYLKMVTVLLLNREITDCP